MKIEQKERLQQLLKHVHPMPCPRMIDEAWQQNCPNCYSQENMAECVISFIEHGNRRHAMDNWVLSGDWAPIEEK